MQATVDEPRRLLNKNFFLLWQGQFVSQLGNQAHAIAMMYWLKRATESASVMGLIMMVTMLPGVLLGPFGGTGCRCLAGVDDVLCPGCS